MSCIAFSSFLFFSFLSFILPEGGGADDFPHLTFYFPSACKNHILCNLHVVQYTAFVQVIFNNAPEPSHSNAIAKAIGFRNKKQINPTLFDMQRKGLLQKVRSHESLLTIICLPLFHFQIMARNNRWNFQTTPPSFNRSHGVLISVSVVNMKHKEISRLWSRVVTSVPRALPNLDTGGVSGSFPSMFSIIFTSGIPILHNDQSL